MSTTDATNGLFHNRKFTVFHTSVAFFLMLGIATLSTGWRKSDTVGLAAGIGSQVAPAVLNANNAKAKGNSYSKEELECINLIKSNPYSTIGHIDNYLFNYKNGKVDNILNGIRYTELCNESDSIPLYKEEIFSGSSYPYMLYKNGRGYNEVHSKPIVINGEPFSPSIEFTGGANYPAFSFYFIGDAKDDPSRSSCALVGIANNFPPDSDVKDIGMRVKQKYDASFKMENSGEEINSSIELTPYTYSYSRSTLVLTNDSVVVKLICGDSKTFKMAKYDKEQYRKIFFHNPDLNIKLKLEVGMTYDEIMSFLENEDNKYSMGYSGMEQFVAGLNKAFESAYAEELSPDMLQEIKDKSGQITMLVFDKKMVDEYRAVLRQEEQDELKAARDAEEKAVAEKEMQKQQALDF